MENHAEGELGREQGEEPLGGIHVSLQVQLLEVGPKVWKLLLWRKSIKRIRKLGDETSFIKMYCEETLSLHHFYSDLNELGIKKYTLKDRFISE